MGNVLRFSTSTNTGHRRTTVFNFTDLFIRSLRPSSTQFEVRDEKVPVRCLQRSGPS
jgi:hypothetical protein